MNRRDFFATAAAAGAGLAAASTARNVLAFSIPDPAQPGVLRLASQEDLVPGKDLKEKLANLEKFGFDGVEFGGGGTPGRVKEIQDALKGSKIRPSAICAGFRGIIISEKEETRREAVASMKEILTAGGEFGSTGLIIVPAFHGQTKLGHQESRKILVDLLKELGEHAVTAKCPILLEPLNRGECYFLRQVADAAAICRDVGSPGVCLMGDFWHMTIEETSDMGAFISAGKHLKHVHIASRKHRQIPGTDEGDTYVDGFRGLKAIGYQDFVSFECGFKDGEEPTVALPKAARFLRQEWGKA